MSDIHQAFETLRVDVIKLVARVAKLEQPNARAEAVLLKLGELERRAGMLPKPAPAPAPEVVLSAAPVVPPVPPISVPTRGHPIAPRVVQASPVLAAVSAEAAAPAMALLAEVLGVPNLSPKRLEGFFSALGSVVTEELRKAVDTLGELGELVGSEAPPVEVPPVPPVPPIVVPAPASMLAELGINPASVVEFTQTDR